MAKRLSYEEVLQRVNTVHHGAIVFADEYPGLTSLRTNFKCRKNHIWKAPTHRIFNGHGCPECKWEKLGERYRYPIEKFNKLLAERDFKLIGEHTNMNSKADFLCLVCNKVVNIQIRQACYAPQGCPHCANFARRSTGGYSLQAIRWIDEVSKLLRLRFKHNENSGEVKLDLGISKRGGNTSVDGFNDRYQVICEFDGDYWHGRADKRSKKHKDTVFRTNRMLELGYVVIHVWQKDYEKGDLGQVFCKDSRGKDFARDLGVKFTKTQEIYQL